LVTGAGPGLLDDARYVAIRAPSAWRWCGRCSCLRANAAAINAAFAITTLSRQPPWRQWKETYIDHVRTASPSVRLVSATDKLHNARAILRGYRRLGEKLWPRFNGGKEGTLWYYRALVEAFAASGQTELIDEHDRVVTEIEHLSGYRWRSADDDSAAPRSIANRANGI
jgi:hypothetical protein